MTYPPFHPKLPKGYWHAIAHVSWIKTGHLITYDVHSDTGYREQRTAFVQDGTNHVKWDLINWADTSHVKEYRAQKVERVRLKAKRRRVWLTR